MTPKTRFLLPALALLLVAAVCARADVNARVVLADGNGSPEACQLRWLPVDKVYNVTFKRDGNPQRRVKPEGILKMSVEPPAGFKDLEARARKEPKSATTAMRGQLEKIAADYKMLQFDAEAGKLIAEGFLAANNAAEAVNACKKIVSGNPRAGWDSALAPVYWRALLDANKLAEVEGLVNKGATSLDPNVAIMACLRRGDLLAKKGDQKLALKDGYLRAVLLYRGPDDARAEALFRAAEAFEKLGQNSYAERMRDELRSKYARTAWGRKLLGD